MTDRLPKDEVAVLEERIVRLEAELDALRLAPPIAPDVKANWLVRTWRRVFGHRIYDGPKTCGHCVYHAPLMLARDGLWYLRLPDFEQARERAHGCKLLAHGWKREHEAAACARFTPERRYYREVKR